MKVVLVAIATFIKSGKRRKFKLTDKEVFKLINSSYED